MDVHVIYPIKTIDALDQNIFTKGTIAQGYRIIVFIKLMQPWRLHEGSFSTVRNRTLSVNVNFYYLARISKKSVNY